MPKHVAQPGFSLVGFASIGALAGVLLAVLVGLVHPLDVQRAAPGELRARLAGESAVESIVPALAPVTMPAPSDPAPNVSRMTSAESDGATRHARRMDVCPDASRPACRRVFEQALGTGAAASPPSAAATSSGDAVAQAGGEPR